MQLRFLNADLATLPCFLFFLLCFKSLHGFQFSSPAAESGFWEDLQRERQKPLFGKVKSSGDALVRDGHLTLSPDLDLDQQKAEIKSWLKGTFFAGIDYWDQREQANLEVEALSIMEKGGFTLPLDWSDEDSLRHLTSWCERTFGYQSMLSPTDSKLTARQRAEAMLRAASMRREEEATHFRKFLARQKHLRRSCYYCF